MLYRHVVMLFLLSFSSISMVFADSDYETIWKQAHTGDKEAQYALAWLFEPARHVLPTQDNVCDDYQFFANNQCNEPNYEQFCYWSKQAADQGVAESLNNVGFCYENGYLDSDKNKQIAIQYYYKAAEKNIVEAQYNLGVMFLRENSYKKAEHWLLKATDQDYHPAFPVLVNLYLFKLNQENNALKIIEKVNALSPLYNEAITSNYYLAYYYLENKSYTKAYKEYEKTLSHIEMDNDRLEWHDSSWFYTQSSLAWLILTGYGTEQNKDKAIELFYDIYRDMFNHQLHKLDNYLEDAEYINLQEKQWNMMFLDIVFGTSQIDQKTKIQLFADLFPNNPYALTQFNQHIDTLKQAGVRDIKIKYPELFRPFSFDPNLTCRDFLHEFDPDAPDYFQYSNCNVNDHGQTRPVEVTYKIEGTHAKQAEQYLIAKMGINKLKFLCCYWETGKYPSATILNPKDNMYYEIHFSSEETLYTSPDDWDKVTFYLRIEGGREGI